MKYSAFRTTQKVTNIACENGLTHIDLDCGTEVHRITVGNDRIILQDHPDDRLEEDEIGAALQGRKLGCVELKKELYDQRKRGWVDF